MEITNEENRRNAIVETTENPEPVEEIVECTENKQVESESSEKMAETEELNRILKVTVSLQIESEKINKGPEQVITADQSFTRTNENTLVSGENPELDEEIVECSENIEDENDISEEITQSEDNEKVLEDTVSVSLYTESENTNKRREQALTADQNYKSSDASEDPSLGWSLQKKNPNFFMEKKMCSPFTVIRPKLLIFLYFNILFFMLCHPFWG